MDAYLVEHYWPNVTEEAFRRATESVRRSAAELAGVTVLHSTLVPSDEAAFCVFAAPSAEHVAEAYRRAGVPFERILDALEIGR